MKIIKRTLRRPGNILNVPSASMKEQFKLIFIFIYAPLLIEGIKKNIFPEYKINLAFLIPFISATTIMMQNYKTLFAVKSYVKKEIKRRHYSLLVRTLLFIVVGVSFMWYSLFHLSRSYNYLSPIGRKIYAFSAIYFIISHIYRHIIEFSNFIVEMPLKNSLQVLETYAYLRYLFYVILIYLYIMPILVIFPFPTNILLFLLIFSLTYAFLLAPLVSYAVRNKNVEYSIKILKTIKKGNNTFPKIKKAAGIEDPKILKRLLKRLENNLMLEKRNRRYRVLLYSVQ